MTVLATSAGYYEGETSGLTPGTCLIHGYHGRTACPTCSTSAALAPPLESYRNLPCAPVEQPRSVGIVCTCGKAVAIAAGLIATCECGRSWSVSAMRIR